MATRSIIRDYNDDGDLYTQALKGEGLLIRGLSLQPRRRSPLILSVNEGKPILTLKC